MSYLNSKKKKSNNENVFIINIIIFHSKYISPGHWGEEVRADGEGSDGGIESKEGYQWDSVWTGEALGEKFLEEQMRVIALYNIDYKKMPATIDYNLLIMAGIYESRLNSARYSNFDYLIEDFGIREYTRDDEKKETLLWKKQ